MKPRIEEIIVDSNFSLNSKLQLQCFDFPSNTFHQKSGNANK